MQDAETEPPEAPAQLGGEGKKDVRDLKSGGKERGGTEGKAGGGTQQWRLRLSWQGAGEEEWGRDGEGDRRGPPTLLQENRSSPGPCSGAHPVPDMPGAGHHCGTFS